MKKISIFVNLHKAMITRILIASVFIILVFVPLITMFLKIDSESLKEVINSHNFWPSISNSIIVSGVATVVTIIIAYLLALCIERSNIKFKGIFAIIFVVPMLIPSISNGMGLVILFGNNGIITNIFNVNFNIYGFNGIILGSVLYAFPVAYLMISALISFLTVAMKQYKFLCSYFSDFRHYEIRR